MFQAGAVALGLLSAMRLHASDIVLITAAAGRIGSLLVQTAKSAGATVIGAAGRDKQALAAAARGGLTPRIHARFPLDQAADAHRELEARRSVGAVILTC